MSQKVYLVVGSPGSGKTWVCKQLTDKFTHVAHDAYIGHGYAYSGDAYVKDIVEAAKGSKPVLCESPFGVSELKAKIESHGLQVTLIFIIESERTLMSRYEKREGKGIPVGHLTRQNTYRQRAIETGSFLGTSKQVLEHLKMI